MQNKYLKRELEKSVLDMLEHEIFENVQEQDLEELKQKIKHLPFNNLIIEFDMEKINNSKLLNMYPYGSKESIEIWDEFVATQIFKAINGSPNPLEEIIYYETEEKYKEKTSNDGSTLKGNELVKIYIQMVNTVYRLYFIIKDCKNKALYNAVSSYLDQNVSSTMILCNSNFIYKVKREENKEEWIWDIYDYVIFDGFNEGMESSKMRSNKVLKKEREVTWKLKELMEKQ